MPISHSQDGVGPHCRTVADAAAVLGGIVSKTTDPRGPATSTNRNKVFTDYTQFLDTNGLKGARIGIARAGMSGFSDETNAIFAAAVAAIKDPKVGAIVFDPVDIPSAGPDQSVHGQRDHAGAEYEAALAQERLIGGPQRIDAALASHNLDALVSPTGSPAWTTDVVNGDHFLGASSSPAAIAGYPSISVPAGDAFGLPVGISFIGTAFSEPKLIKLANGFEAVTKARKVPQFLPALPDENPGGRRRAPPSPRRATGTASRRGLGRR